MLAIRPIAVVVFTKIQPGNTLLHAVKHWLATQMGLREVTGKTRVEVYAASPDDRLRDPNRGKLDNERTYRQFAARRDLV